MKILLCCGSGASTSMVAESMLKAVPEEQRADYTIVADTYQNFSTVFHEYDVVLLGPHIRYKKAALQKEAASLQIPVDVIDGTDYALQNGAKILAQAQKLYADARQ
ncbi:MAG: PTS sugar transporter subunit IIB [Enterobacteriaceae bacterium]